MLVEFRVANHRSLRGEQALTLTAGRVGEPDDPRPRTVPGHVERLLTVAGLYGANASGKSNVLSALAFMQEAVLSSHRLWLPTDGVPRDAFAWGEAAASPSVFEVELVLEGVRYRYGFACDDERFVEEWLHAWPRGRKQVWFERDWQEGRETVKFGDALGGDGRAANHLVRDITRPNALLLSAAAQLDLGAVLAPYAWFAGLKWGGAQLARAGRGDAERVLFWRRSRPRSTEAMAARLLARGRVNQLNLFDLPGLRDDGVDDLALFKSFILAADLGIVDIALKSDGDPTGGEARVMFRHAAQDPTEEAWLPLEAESRGTRALFSLGPLVVDALRRGGLLVVDELESGLHPQLALALVRHFNDPALNPHHAQLLFTTHDTHLLGTTAAEAALRRDQVWLTEKDGTGATTLYPLTDFKPRKAENLERGYLQGRYGAVPFLGELASPPGQERGE